jgi:hypothetical protein
MIFVLIFVGVVAFGAAVVRQLPHRGDGRPGDQKTMARKKVIPETPISPW